MIVGHTCLDLCVFLFAFSDAKQPIPAPRNNKVQERKSLPNFGQILRSESYKAGIQDFLTNLGPVGNLATIDYDAPPKQVIKAVGDAIVPAIAAGLAFIPGVGPVIGGLISGIWGLFSGLFGGGGKSPMEKMIDEIQDDIKKLKNEVAEFKANINITIQKHIDAKLSQIVSQAVHGELRRNEYICSKYAILSKSFSEDLKNNRSINDSIRCEMVAMIQDCDNFLKDTAEVFLNSEFADVLWVPAVFTTLVRVSFLTEICNYGALLSIDEKILKLFWKEIKNDISKCIEFSGLGVINKGKVRRTISFATLPKFGDFPVEEREGCRMQAQLLYLDREIYRYGVPKSVLIDADEAELNLSDLNVTDSDERHQIFIYFNTQTMIGVRYSFAFNCFTGPGAVHLLVPSVNLSVIFVANKTYELRLLYFTAEETDARVTVSEKNGNAFTVRIDEGKPNEASFQRFVLKSALLLLKFNHRYLTYQTDAVKGSFVVESVVGFNLQTSDGVFGKIEIINVRYWYQFLLGVELIVMPTTNVTQFKSSRK